MLKDLPDDRQVIAAGKFKIDLRAHGMELDSETSMHMLILGINHQIQPRQILSWGSGGQPQQFEREQKERFCDLLCMRMAERAVDFVGEEALAYTGIASPGSVRGPKMSLREYRAPSGRESS